MNRKRPTSKSTTVQSQDVRGKEISQEFLERKRSQTKGQELEWNSTAQQNTDSYQIKKQRKHGIQKIWDATRERWCRNSQGGGGGKSVNCRTGTLSSTQSRPRQVLGDLHIRCPKEEAGKLLRRVPLWPHGLYRPEYWNG